MLKAPKRLQRIMPSLQDYSLNVKWKPGKEMMFADLLSRAPHINKYNFAHLEDKMVNSINEIEQIDNLTEITVSKNGIKRLRIAQYQD